MIAVGGGSKMPCESCGVQFSVFRRKRACSECERLYCAACLRRGGGMCAPCRALSTRPLARNLIAHLKVRDLQCFLQRQNVSTRGCVEKEELVSLCVGHVNSSAYRRRGSRTPTSGPFTTLKGLTNNFNDLINSAFDLRSNAQPQHPPPNTMHTGNCFNTAHAHPAVPPPTATPRHERFTTTPGGERDIEVPVPLPAGGAALGGRSASADSAAGARRDTADCFEVEDVDDAGWEFVTRPADPLPGDSDVLLTANELNTTRCTESDDVENRDSTNEGSSEREPASRAADSLRPDAAAPRPAARAEAALRAGATPARAASELDLRRAPPSPGSTSLQDESLMDRDSETPQQVSLDQVREEAELEAMSVKQLKELLARNRVEFRGCLERADLLERARMLYRDHSKYKDEVDSLPLEECCKICMAAPLECVLLECGHIAACTACSKQLAECPICRQYVVRAVRFFRS